MLQEEEELKPKKSSLEESDEEDDEQGGGKGKKVKAVAYGPPLNLTAPLEPPMAEGEVPKIAHMSNIVGEGGGGVQAC